MDSPPIQEETEWNSHMLQPLEHVATRSQSPKSESPDPRRPSADGSDRLGSVSTGTGEAGSSRGRRSRPSVTAASSQLTSVREMKAKKGQPRHLSSVTTVADGSRRDRPSVASKDESEENVVSTKQVLMSFSKQASRNVEKEEARAQMINRYAEENEIQRRVYRRLAKWEDTKTKGWKEFLLSLVLPSYRRTLLPHADELASLARHYYPPRSELKCHICDFGDGRAEHKTVELGDIEDYMVVKPDWVDVRWIHAPLGLGLMHSSVEDIFLHEGDKGRLFENAGRSGWPYLETEIYNLKHRQNFQEMRDVYLLLRDRKELHDELNESTWKSDRNASLHHDIDWRANHMATEPTFWNLVSTDLPWQVSEGLSMGSLVHKDGLQPLSRFVDKQALAKHNFYKDAQVARNPFRTFHRGDGFLLTLSSMNGINYLDKDFSQYLAEPLDASFDNDDASALGHAFHAFAENGTSTWHRKSVEWFLIYLITEVGVTPHPYRQGFNAPTLDGAYSSVIQDLKRRRFDEWKPKKTVELVRDYLTCLDEITYITLNLQSKVRLFSIVQMDVKRFEAEDTRMGRVPDNPAGESMLSRLDWALNHVKQQHEIFERLLIDLRQSLDALFQLRSIEQNDMAIVSDSQNKAIIVFTGVTIVFLPLSFFTSYFGMNLTDLVKSGWTQREFWKVCGSVAFLIVLFVTLGAFRHNLKRVLRQKVGKVRRSMV